MIQQKKSAAERLREFEASEYNQDVLRLYRDNAAIPHDQKEKDRKLWDNYYALCNQSLEAQLFWDMRAALKSGDMPKVRELRDWAKESKQQESLIPRPPCPDPYVYENNQGILVYTMLLRDVDRESRRESSGDKIFS